MMWGAFGRRFSASSMLALMCVFLMTASDVTAYSIEKQIIDAATKAEMLDMFHLMPDGQVLVMTELDIMMTLDQYRHMHQKTSDVTRRKRKAERDVTYRWTNCEVYYEILDSLDKKATKIIESTIAQWEKYTCLDFKENSTEKMRIKFQDDGSGCNSFVGMQTEPQPINLAPGCLHEGIVIHEIGHAIGWRHEQTRPDRDEYIVYNEEGVPSNLRHNFRKYTEEEINTYGVPYDYNSIMHYGSTAFNSSIMTLDPRFQKVIGQRAGLSFKDIKLANLMYNCARVMNCRNDKYNCKYNGFVFYKSFNGKGPCQCWCDSGNVNDPLVLCSEIDREAPQPNPGPRPADLPVAVSCYDVREDCEDMKSHGMCMSKMEMMEGLCSKTCNFCGKGGDLCMDHESSCPLVAASGLCADPGFESIMATMCPASCGVCKMSEPCQVQHELLGAPPNPNAAVETSALCLWFFGFVMVTIFVWWHGKTSHIGPGKIF